MEGHKAPRVNRSKKVLPAAFCTRESFLPPAGPANAVPVSYAGVAASASQGHASSGGSVTGVPGAVRPGPVVARVPSITGIFGERSSERKRVRLESLVFLSSCPQRSSHVVMKKMLHPPTLGLYCLMELPVSGAEHQRTVLRAHLQSWLGPWCDMQREHPDLLVAVCEAFWDAPQGYPMSILCEYMPLGSLDELVQAAGGLPEEALREVTQALLQALEVLHSAEPLPMVHGCLKPSQVLFGIDGRPRLSFGLDQRLKSSQAGLNAGGHHHHHHADAAPAAGDGGEHTPAVDIFDLGVLLLVAALGGLDVLLGAIAYAQEIGTGPSPAAPSMISPDTCSLLQEELRGAVAAAVAGDMHGGHGGHADGPGGYAGAGDDEMGYLPAASDLLFNRNYSEPFLSFVATCLEAHNRSAIVRAQDLLQHEFLQQPCSAGPLVYLRDMQELARLLNETPGRDPSVFGPAKNSFSQLPGVAPSVAQRSQLYVANIAQSVVSYCGPPPWRSHGVAGRSRSMSESEVGLRSNSQAQRQEWETLVRDTARTLGLPVAVVQQMLDVQLDRQTQFTARGRRGG